MIHHTLGAIVELRTTSRVRESLAEAGLRPRANSNEDGKTWPVVCEVSTLKKNCSNQAIV